MLLEDTSLPQDTIKLTMIVKNNCIHVKGQDYGQLRGPAREEAVWAFIAGGQKPAEYAKSSLQSASDSAFHCQNRGTAVTKASAQNISREASQKKLADSGLTKCKLCNIEIARRITEKDDIESRERLMILREIFLELLVQ
jgi:hypothetical protein